MGFRLVRTVVSLGLFASGSAAPENRIGPDLDVAAERGPHIFNAVFDSLRIYNSAIHPNGMSFFLATVPEGAILHHGNTRNSSPSTLDWIAYEIEHAEVFANVWHRRPRRGRPRLLSAINGGTQVVFDDISEVQASDDDEEEHGWLHTYRATRPLQFLYIDGMSGNKDNTGVIDSQDYILRAGDGDKKRPPGAPGAPIPPGEGPRAQELCELAGELGLQGVIRTEDPGMEIIKCDFSDGLEELQSLQRKDEYYNDFNANGGPGRSPGEHPGDKFPYSYENCFHDIGSYRTYLDYSTMVSAFYFPVNLTNPNQEEQELPRLVSTDKADLQAIKEYLRATISNKRDHARHEKTSWRDVADLIVRRYAPRFKLMSNKTAVTTVAEFAEGVRFLTNVFVDYSVADSKVRDSEARERCATFYLQTKLLETESDRFIYEAFKATNERICEVLFDVKNLVIDEAVTSNTLSVAQESISKLKDYLDWAVFERHYV